MIEGERLDKLLSAAEYLYKNFCDPEKGFYAGCVKNRVTGKPVHVFNQYPGVHKVIEQKLQRKLNKYEITVLSVAIGEGSTPIMTQQEREDAFAYMFPRGKDDYEKKFVTLEKLMSGI